MISVSSGASGLARSFKHRRALKLTGTLLAVAAVAGAIGVGSAAASSKPLSGKTVTIVSLTNSNPWAAVYNTVIKTYMTGLGAKVNILGASTASQQVQMLESAVAEKPNLIFLEALDSSAVAPAIAKAKAEHVTIINTDGPAEASVTSGLHQVLSNNYQLGQYAAENLVEGFQQEHLKKADIGVIEGTAAMLVTQDRMKGFNQILHKYPQYKVVSLQSNDWDPVQSGQQATQMFAKFGKSGLQGMYGMADYMAVPIVTAAKQAGITIGVKHHGLIITGSNCFKVGIDAIRAGQLFGTATEDPGTISALAAKYGAQLLQGKKVPMVETVQEKRITAANLSKYSAQCSKA
ncbi:MAG TPA: sugar ABC transporter substrate-binding protein [Solirubrobacteraceae bacterium]|jgi:ribose transport system substrate-binding protein|nr:sugar ABC transporter substrate-binding protein [Solirubrobacteraceae bacterium]